MSALDQLLDALPPWALVVGKGGVGKTTCAVALAQRASARRGRTLLLSTDPAGTLGAALDVALGDAPQPIAGCPALFAVQVNPDTARRTFLERWRATLLTVLDRGTYLDRDDLAPLVDEALPGLDETMALVALAELPMGEWARLITDTAPTGHTLRLLALPRSVAGVLDLLETMQDKHRFMVRALTHGYRTDEVDRFLSELRGRFAGLEARLRDARRTAAVIVTRAESLVVSESTRLIAGLEALGVAVAALVINDVAREPTPESDAALQALAPVAPGVPRFFVPHLDEAPAGPAAIAQWGMQMLTGAPAVASMPARARRTLPFAPALDRYGALARQAGHAPDPAAGFARQLLIVGGKGGVGKTTVACALGVAAARSGASVLVVSTDPAPSVADAMAQPIGDAITPVGGAPGLWAQQLDATAAFERFRERYQERVEAVFATVTGAHGDAVYDRRIARDLIALAPPGIDELYAITALGEIATQRHFDRVIVDPAPTGHLLRLLELPELALAWTHHLLRVLLRYRELAGLGEGVTDLLAFARRTRALRDQLHDPTRAAVLLVTIDEPLVRQETTRLLRRVESSRIAVLGVVWNRATAAPTPLPGSAVPPQLEAMESTPPPRGIGALEQWSRSWTPLASRSDD